MSEQSNTPKGTAFNLADQVEYAEGAVVSKTLIKKEIGTITLFAFDRGQGLSEHSAPFDALVQCVEGEIEVTIAGTAYPLEAGQVVLMPKDVPHAVRAPSRCKMLLTMLRGS